MKKYRSESPLFTDLLSWLEKKNTRRLRGFFPLRSYSTWEHTRPGWRPMLTNVTKLREVIQRELVDPLFMRRGLNVRFESDISGHRRDNAYCCIEFYRKQLKRARASDLETVLSAFKEDFQKALPGARFPFAWMIDQRDPAAKEWDELMEREKLFDRNLRLDYRNAYGAKLHELTEREDAASWAFKREEKDLTWARDLGLSNERKRGYALRYCEYLALYMKAGRGKPGQHPREFNVLVYHIIKKCTTRKLDWKKRAAGQTCDMKRKDGQYRLETDWKLVMFLLLGLHAHTQNLPDVARFVASHQKQPAPKAIRSMQAWLLNIRKNFPPIHGWPMNKEGYPVPETGFRKIIVTGEGGLRSIWL